MNILIVGASGYIGGAIYSHFDGMANVNACGSYCANAVNPEFTKIDLIDFDEVIVRKTLSQYEVIIIACSIAKLADEASVARIAGNYSRFLDACASKYVIYLSSDAVFRGVKGGYLETDPVDAVTQYGRSHIKFEDQTLSRQGTAVVRTSYVFGYSQGVLDKRLTKAIQTYKAGKIQASEGLFRSPTCVSFLAQQIGALVTDRATGTFHVAGGRMSVNEFLSKSLSTLLDEPVSVPNLELSKGAARDTSLGGPLCQPDRNDIRSCLTAG